MGTAAPVGTIATDVGVSAAAASEAAEKLLTAHTAVHVDDD